MMKIKKIGYSILVFLAFSLSAKSQVANATTQQETKSTKSEAGGPATATELIGFWKMIPVNPAVNKINPWPQKRQWFEFTKDGKIYSMMTNSDDKEYTEAELNTAFKVFTKIEVPNYKVQGQYVIIDNPKIKNYFELWGTNIFAKDIEGLAKKGDLIMTLDDGTQTGKVVYYRLLRKIN